MVDTVSAPADTTEPTRRGCAFVGFAILGGALLGLIVGTLAGYGSGFVWIELTPTWNRAREMGIAVVLIFAPIGGILGAILGAVLFGRRAARRGPTTFDRILLVVVVIVAALAAFGLLLLGPLLWTWGR